MPAGDLQLDVAKDLFWQTAHVDISKIDGAKHLCEIERLVSEHNESEMQMPIKPPDLKLVVTGTEYGFRRDDGVFVIPIGSLAP